MKRTKPRKPRNAYRDPVWCRAVLRCWSRNTGQADLDALFANAMKEMPMQNDVELELTVRGRDRTLNLPRVSLTNLEPALSRLDWYRQTAAVDQRVAERAEAALNALARAVSS